MCKLKKIHVGFDKPKDFDSSSDLDFTLVKTTEASFFDMISNTT